jgi:RNA polymerase sigma-70 factor (ECF subfamily)
VTSLVLTRESQRVTIDDQEVARRVIAGQTEEFRVLVDRHQQAIFRYVYGLLWNHADAHDVTQEVFLAAFMNLSSYAWSRAEFSTWLFTIARNRCINLLKRNRARALDNPTLIQDIASVDTLANHELRQQLDRALAALPVDQRSAFLLAEVEELSYAEIAQIERTSLGTVKSRIHRAKQRLRSLLEPVMREPT